MLHIWKLIQQGDQNAFKAAFDKYYDQMCLYANKILNDINLSQDIVSECFIRIWEKRESIEITSSLKYYLVLSVRNTAISHLRKSGNKSEILVSDIIEVDAPYDEKDILEEEEFIIRIHQAINKLPEQRRKILELASFNNMSYKEIALTLDISVNTVKTQMARAYRFLKEELNTTYHLLFYFISK